RVPLRVFLPPFETRQRLPASVALQLRDHAALPALLARDGSSRAARSSPAPRDRAELWGDSGGILTGAAAPTPRLRQPRRFALWCCANATYVSVPKGHLRALGA